MSKKELKEIDMYVLATKAFESNYLKGNEDAIKHFYQDPKKMQGWMPDYNAFVLGWITAHTPYVEDLNKEVAAAALLLRANQFALNQATDKPHAPKEKLH